MTRVTRMAGITRMTRMTRMAGITRMTKDDKGDWDGWYY